MGGRPPARPKALPAPAGAAAARAEGTTALTAPRRGATSSCPRVNVVTGDPQVLASVGSLLTPGGLSLALLPASASAAGAAVVRHAPIFLTQQTRWGAPGRLTLPWGPGCVHDGDIHPGLGAGGRALPLQHAAFAGVPPHRPTLPNPTALTCCRQGLACYDFEGGAVFCLPITQQPAAPAAPDALVPPPPARCVGALLLSFQAAEQLDGEHARHLLLLAAALAPGLLAAAAPLLEQCHLILGVPPPPPPGAAAGAAAALEAAAESEGEAEGGAGYLTESEEEGEEAWQEEEDAGEAAEAAAEEEQQQRPEWAAGRCRTRSPEPPEDPGAGAALLAVQPQRGEAAGSAAVQDAAEAGRAAESQAQRADALGGVASAAAAAVLLKCQRGGVPGSQAAAAAPLLPPSPVAVASQRSSMETAGGGTPMQGGAVSPHAARRSRLSVEGSRAGAAAASHSPTGQRPQPEPESPSVLKAWAKAAAVGAAPEGTAPPGMEGELGKLLPSSISSEASSGAAEGLAAQAGATLLRLLRFRDASLEARFARWQCRQLWRVSRAAGRFACHACCRLCAMQRPGCTLQLPCCFCRRMR